MIKVKEYAFSFTEKYAINIRKKLKRDIYPVEFVVAKYEMIIERRCPHE